MPRRACAVLAPGAAVAAPLSPPTAGNEPAGEPAACHRTLRRSFFTRGRSDAGDAGQELRLLLPAVAAQARFRSAIFDGEICGWDKAAATFTEFRTVRPILNAAGRHAERGTVIASWKARSGGARQLPPYCLFSIFLMNVFGGTCWSS